MNCLYARGQLALCRACLWSVSHGMNVIGVCVGGGESVCYLINCDKYKQTRMHLERRSGHLSQVSPIGLPYVRDRNSRWPEFIMAPWDPKQYTNA